MNQRFLIAHANRRAHLNLQRILRTPHASGAVSGSNSGARAESTLKIDSIFNRESVLDLVWQAEREGRPYQILVIQAQLLAHANLQTWLKDLRLLSPNLSILVAFPDQDALTQQTSLEPGFPGLQGSLFEPFDAQQVLEMCGLSSRPVGPHPEVDRVVSALRNLETSYQRLYETVAAETERPAQPEALHSARRPEEPVVRGVIEKELFEAVRELGHHLQRCQPLIARMSATTAPRIVEPTAGNPPDLPGEHHPPPNRSFWQRLRRALHPTPSPDLQSPVQVDVGPSGVHFRIRVCSSDVPHDVASDAADARPSISQADANPEVAHQLLSGRGGRLSLVSRRDSTSTDVSIHLPNPSPCPNRAGE